MNRPNNQSKPRERPAKERGGKPDHREQKNSKLDEALDRGLEESFPASDPVSIVQPPPNPCDKDEE